MQLRVRHTTGYRYAEGAIASFNEARMTPMTTADQIVLRSRIDVVDHRVPGLLGRGRDRVRGARAA